MILKRELPPARKSGIIPYKQNRTTKGQTP